MLYNNFHNLTDLSEIVLHRSFCSQYSPSASDVDSGLYKCVAIFDFSEQDDAFKKVLRFLIYDIWYVICDKVEAKGIESDNANKICEFRECYDQG
jgi:hypothetical protein